MSKAVKKIFKAVKKAVKWVAKNIVPILAVAAIIYTGGAAMGYFQGVAGGGGAVGMQGIQAAWGVGAGAAPAALNADAALAGTAEANAAIAGSGLGELSVADAATNAAISGVADASAAADMASLSTMAPGLMAPAATAPIGASILHGAGTTAKAVGGFMGTPGGGIATAAGLQAGGAYLQSTAEEKRRREELDRFNRETNAYGLNRYGENLDPNAPQHDFAQDFTFNPGGLMAPQVQAPQVPTPTTIDELIAARQQQARA